GGRDAGGGAVIRPVHLRSVLLAVAVIVSAPAYPQDPPGPAVEVEAPAYFDLRRITPISGDPVRGQEQSQMCAACHGPDGISIVPIYPDLAGQRADYMYWQLRKFKHTEGSVMSPLVANLDDQDMRDLALYYAGLPASPTPAAGAGDEPDGGSAGHDPALLARGQQLYLHGDPAAGIPPCQGCHGPDGRGHPLAGEPDAAGYTPRTAYPALRGQKEAYLAKRLAEYQQGGHGQLTTDF